MKPAHIFLVILTGLLLTWLFGLLVFTVKSSGLQTLPEKADSIVVLTGGPGRIEKGLELFSQGQSGYLFISGIHPDVIRKEITSKWHGKSALPQCCMVLGRKATTTTENALETKEWIEKNDIHSFILITSDYHMPRAKLEMEAALPADIKIISYPVSTYLPHQSRAKLFFSEYNKTLYRWAQIKFAGIAKLD